MTWRKRADSSVVHPRKFCEAKLVRVKNAMYYVYILKSDRDKKLYSGYTADLKARLLEHNKGNVDSTKHRIPFKLIYYEAYLHQQDATTREKFFKTQWGRRYLKRVLKNYLGG